MENIIVDSIENLDLVLNRVREAQKEFSKYTQEQVDRIFKDAAIAANQARIPLAKMAVEETGMGVIEDKAIKNHYASEYIYNKYRNEMTCGVVEDDKVYGIKKVMEPIGVVAAVIPTTNPTSTAIFKILLALKTRNGIVISPHPRAKNSTIMAAKIVLDAAVKAGAPKDIVAWIDVPSLELTNHLMHEADLILATGGPGMVKSAYSSGKPALGVGAGNTPAIIDDSSDILLAVNSIIHSKTFDNGMICASEQAVIIDKEIYDEVVSEFKKLGTYIVNKNEKKKLETYMFGVNAETDLTKVKLNSNVVGKEASYIANEAGINAPKNVTILGVECEKVGVNEPLTREKLSPVLASKMNNVQSETSSTL